MKGKIERDLLRLLIGEQRESQRIQYVRRNYELPLSNEKIFSIIGVRRSGKTVFLKQVIDDLISKGSSEDQILFLNFEDDRLFPTSGQDLARLLELFYEIFPDNHNSTCHIFLDEIQNVEGWSRVIRRFIDTRDVIFYLSGSSSKLLSKEIATTLRGRSSVLEIFPYSFKEFLIANKEALPRENLGPAGRNKLLFNLDRYLMEGGFPALTNLPLQIKNQRLQSYIELVTFRDIVERYKVSNIKLLKYLIDSMVSSSGTAYSINKFYKDIKSQGYSASKDTIYNYQKFIEDSFLTFLIPLDSDSLRKRETNPRKVYAVDTGLSSSLLFEPEKRFGQLLKTAVFIELRKRAGSVSYHLTPEGYEIDFVHTKPDGSKDYYQVAYDITNPETKKRELRAIESLRKEVGIEAKLITRENFWQMFF